MSLIDVTGHIAFALTFISFFQKNLMRLRMWAILAGVVGLGYNGWVHWRMPDDQGIWPVLFWLSVFLVQNVALAVIEIKNQMEVDLRPASRALLVSTFPSMHSRDWASLLSVREELVLHKGDVLLDVGAPTNKLMMLAFGNLDEERSDGRTLVRSPGVIFGELTFFLGVDEFNASPCRVVLTQDSCVIYAWPYSILTEMCKSPRFKMALEEGVIRSAGLKHGLLSEAAPAHPLCAKRAVNA